MAAEPQEPKYKIEIENDTRENGRLGLGTVIGFDANDKPVASDRGELPRDTVRQRIAEGFAKRLGGDAQKWREAIDKAWGKILDDHHRPQAQKPAGSSGEGDGSSPSPLLLNDDTRPFLCNYFELEKGQRLVKVGFAAAQIAERLSRYTRGWPKRIDDRLFVIERDGTPRWLLKTEELFAWLATTFAADGANGIRWGRGEDCISQNVFAAYLRQNVERFDAIELLPHHPPLSGYYYAYPPLPSSDGTAFAALLARFLPATPVDGELIRALFLTLFWGGPPGQRPAFLILAEENDPQGGRGVGKSKLFQAAARLAGGHIDARPKEDFDKLMTRLLSPGALYQRVAALDNVKALRFSWAELEGLITTDVISGRGLYIGEGKRPNTLVWIITLNAPNLSRDLAQRCVPIRVRRPENDGDWETQTWKLIEERRLAIIADIIHQLQQPASVLSRYSRWGAWEQAVLSRLADPVAAQRLTEQRQGSIDDDKAEADLVRDGFETELRRRGHDPDEEAVWIASATAAEILNAATGERYGVKKASSHLGTLSIKELRKADYEGSRGWAWRGKNAAATEKLRDLLSLDRTPFDP